MELLVVVTLMGIFAAVVASHYGRSLFGEFGANSTARRLSLDLLTCQRTAIKTGDDHYLSFTLSGGEVATYSLMRVTSSGDVLVDGPVAISKDVTVTVSHTKMQFNFEGAANGAYRLLMTGRNRRWQITVVPISGAIAVSEI